MVFIKDHRDMNHCKINILKDLRFFHDRVMARSTVAGNLKTTTNRAISLVELESRMALPSLSSQQQDAVELFPA